MRVTTRAGLTCQLLPSGDHAVRVERDRQNALVGQPLGKIRVVRRALAADTHILTLGQASPNSLLQQLFHGWVALVTLEQATQADEFILVSDVFDPELRLRSLEITAAAHAAL